MTRSTLAYLAVFALTVGPACAPRVSKRAPASYAAASGEAESRRAAKVEPPEEPPAPFVERAEPERPVQVVEQKPAQAAPVQTTEAAKARTNFYAFSDAEVSGLRQRSGDFRKLHDRLKVCTARSEAAIQHKDQVRDDIIRLQNLDARTPKQDKQLTALRQEERKLKAVHEGEDCAKIEVKLTEMLRTVYGSTESAGARH